MKATHLFLLALLLALAGCSSAAHATGSSPGSRAELPEPARSPTMAPPATPTPPFTQSAGAAPTVVRAAGATVPPTTLPSLSPQMPLPTAPARSAASLSQPVVFNIGVPAGDAYGPVSAAIDSSRNLAYVYHADSAERRPVISVVDLAGGKVVRLIRLNQTTPGNNGRLFLTPDGKRLFLQENQEMSILAVDTATGSVRKVLEGARDAVLSDDGRMLYAAHGDAVAAYSPDQLMLGRTEPVWRAGGQFSRLGLSGQRVLTASYGREGALVALDAATGKQVAQGDVPETADAISPGPDGGWAIIVGGEKPRLIRYDAALKNQGETLIMYTGNLTYDLARNRYLVGGLRYRENEPAGYPVMLSINAGDGRVIDEERWGGIAPPTVFLPWGQNTLVAFSAGGPAGLSILDAASLASKGQIATGVRAEDVVVNDQAQKLYVADDLGRIHVLKLPDGEGLAVWEGGFPLALDTVNGRLYANRRAGVVALDAATGTLLAQYPQPGYPAPDPNADLVYIVQRGVTIYNRSGKQLGTLPSTFPVERGYSPNPAAEAAQVNPVTGHVAVIMSNGIPGSNGGTFLRIYPRQSDKGVEPPAPHSFVQDLTAGREGNWYVTYSPARTEEAVQVLSPGGKQLDRLDHRTGYMALDQATDGLYLFMGGRVTRLAASTLTAEEVYEGPEYVSKMDYSPRTQTAYLVGSVAPLVTLVSLDALQPPDLRPVPGRPAPEIVNDGLSIAGQGRQRLLLARFGETFRTTDSAAWERLVPGLEMIFGYSTAVAPRTIFIAGRSVAGNEGVWRSVDGGDNWEWLADGLTDLQASGPVLANSADEAYFFSSGQGLMRWDPVPGKWQQSAPRGSVEQYWFPALAPDGMLFRSYQGNLEQSSDRGVSWVGLGATDRTGDVIGFSALYTVTHTVFTVTRSGYQITGIQRSTDGGKTWQPSISGAPLGFDGYQPEMATGFGDSYLLLRPYNGDPSLLRTTDFGDTWQAAPAGTVQGVEHIAVDPVDGRLWLGVKGEVRSLDPEKLSWTKLPRPQAAGSLPGVSAKCGVRIWAA
jgi:hypothetical protein